MTQTLVVSTAMVKPRLRSSSTMTQDQSWLILAIHVHSHEFAAECLFGTVKIQVGTNHSRSAPRTPSRHKCGSGRHKSASSRQKKQVGADNSNVFNACVKMCRSGGEFAVKTVFVAATCL